MKSKSIIRVAVIQMESLNNKISNLTKAEVFVREAATKSELIALPEVFNYRGPQDTFYDQSENMEGVTVQKFSSIAKELKVDLLLGSILEKSPKSKKCFNTSVHINSYGKVCATYRKMHLFEAQLPDRFVSEGISLQEGKQTQTTNIGNIKAGMSICYDLRFGEQYLKYALNGANLMLVPSAFTHHTGKDHWKTLLRARAIETQSYVVAPNQVGSGGNNILMYGHSLIVDPWGTVLAEASEESEEIIYANIDIDTVNNIRKILPSLACRKSRKT